jgi:multidrug efflux pump
VSISDIFIKRPVLSTVLGLLIILLGLQGLFSLQTRQYPEVDETVITVTTIYPGASAELIQGFVTSPIAAAVANAENVDYVPTQSRPSATGNMVLGANPDNALTEVMSKVQEVRSQLPADAEDPSIVKGTGMTFATMYLAVQNPNMSPEQVTEYIERVIVPRMSTIPGVAESEVLGAQNYAMRVWIDPIRLASRNLTAADVSTAINSSNFLSAPGRTRNELVGYSISMESTLQTPEQFGALPIAGSGNDVVRLRDVAEIELASESTDTVVTFNGNPGTFIGVFPTPGANPLDMAAAVHAELPRIQASLPEGMTLAMVYDSTEQIASSIN